MPLRVWNSLVNKASKPQRVGCTQKAGLSIFGGHEANGETYIDVGDPAQRANHRRLRDGIASIQDEEKDTQPRHGLCSCLGRQSCREETEPSLHGNAHGKQDEIEYAVRSDKTLVSLKV